MHKSKKKSSAKTAKIPKPISIKKEKTEEDRMPHPMTHYIDDRLELVKQIFGTLKPKTITNLAPDFLKKKTLEEIEELCLNELLGISTKRLKSIMNATKCPTDTESSEDSDVHNIEEHVSLEEISSDSEIEGSSSNATKKKFGGSTGGHKKGSKNGAEKKEPDGQISVLELLELQARARAIRSQLALEPVTKIEVHSDGDTTAANVDEKSGKKSKESHSSIRKERKRKSTEMNTTSKTKKANSDPATTSSAAAMQSNGTIANNSSTTSVEPTKKIKLKRNFRTNNEDDERANKFEPIQTSTEKNVKEIKEEKRSRSQSPDVIPIVAEPETLLISDSSSGDEEEAITSTTKITSAENIEQSKTVELQQQHEQKDKQETSSSINRERKVTEPEDGEIYEDSVAPPNDKDKDNFEQISDNVINSTNDKTDDTLSPINCRSADKNDEQVIDNEVKNFENIDSKVAQAEEQKELKIVTVEKEMLEINKKTSESELEGKHFSKISTEQSATEQADDEDDDQNDDVISIEGGDLESEMIEHLDNSDTKISSFKEKDDEIAKCKPEVLQLEEDIISLDSSEDELKNKKDLESWNTRWLKSSKVSKVLAASKLGKRVRDKIKKSKHSKKNSTREDHKDEEENKANSSYTSKHEDGSIEQYKELLDMRQRKT